MTTDESQAAARTIAYTYEADYLAKLADDLADRAENYRDNQEIHDALTDAFEALRVAVHRLDAAAAETLAQTVETRGTEHMTARERLWEGSRVELHPALDAWMMGDRFGTVRKAGRKYVHVLMDRSGKVRRITPENLTIVREA